MHSSRMFQSVKAVAMGAAFVPLVIAINVIPAAAVQKYGPLFLNEKEIHRRIQYQARRQIGH